MPSYPIEVRFGQHDGFDRVTFEHVGDAALGYFAQYEDSIRLENGEEINLGGEVVLHVRVTGVALEEDVGEDVLPDREAFAATPSSSVAEVKTFGPWEGTYHYYVGVDAERPFDVTIEESPLRLVVDIADE